MAQAGYTPIQLYYSTTAAAVPLAANLAQGELAINIADGKLYYENSSGVVTLLASSTTVTNSFSAGTTGFTPSTATTGAVTLGGTLITSNGGTGLASYTAGDLSYYASGTALTKLAIGTAGQILTSSGTAPQWSTLSGVAVTTFSAGTTGFTPSSATAGAVTLAGTLATTNGGTGLTSFTSGGVVYASSTSALATGSALTFDGQTLTVNSNHVLLAAAFTNADTTNGYGVSIAAGGTSATRYALVVRNPASTQDYFKISTVTGEVGHSIFAPGAPGSSEVARFTSTGLGIGTSSPAAKLDVAGNANIKQFVSAGNGTTDGYLGYSWNRNLASGALFDNAKNAYDFLMQPGSNNLFLEIYAPGGGIVSGNALVMTPTGNLGIGTSSPSTSLQVGDATTSGKGIMLRNGGGASRTAYITLIGTTAASADQTWYSGINVFASNGSYELKNAAGNGLTLDTSANLGLGVTPSAWSAGLSVFEFGTKGGLAGGANDVNLIYNSYYNGANSIYRNTDYASYYQQAAGQHRFYTAPSGTAGTVVSYTQAMTLDASGNLGVGTTSPAKRLHVAYNTSSDYTTFRISNSGSTANIDMGVGGSGVGGALANNAYIYNTGNSALVFGTNDTERARIDSSGNLLLGTTTTVSKVTVFGSGNQFLSLTSVTGSATRTGINMNPALNASDSAIYDAQSAIYAVDDNYSANIIFANKITGAVSNALTERARIDSSGRFMIGTVSALDIVTVVMNGSSNGNGLTVRAVNSTGAGSQPGVVLASSAGAICGSVYADVGSVSLNLNNGAGGSIRFLSNSSESARITSDGYVGIATTTPATYGAFAVRKAVTTSDTTNCSASFSDAANSTFDIGHTANIVRLNAQGSAIAFNAGSSERMRLDSSGNLLLGTTSAEARFSLTTAGADSGTYAAVWRNSAATGLLYMNSAGSLELPQIYANFTTGSAANMFISSSGLVQRSTSSLKYKKNIQDATHGLAEVLQLRPVTYEGKSETDVGKTFGGLIAEEVHAVGLTEFVQYAEDGSPDALAYGNMVSLLTKAIQEQQTIIESLKARLDAANL